MKSVVYVPGAKELRLVERPEPQITAPDEIKVKTIRVGICGTDREKAAEDALMLPKGKKDLVIGHEILGRVVDVGKDVKRVRPGDYAVFTVRRGCGKCLPCAINRSDMCSTGEYSERGIRGVDGFQAEYVVDKEQYIIAVPKEIEALGVLCEPLSVIEKAIDEVLKIQFARLPGSAATPDWFYGRRCLVTGLGPIGLLAATALRLRNVEVYGLDIVDEHTARPEWLEGIGGGYIDGRKVTPDKIDDAIGRVDIIFEASGVPNLAFNLPDVLGHNGVYVFTGMPVGNTSIQMQGAELMRQMVHGNQVLMGSVNGARDHFQMAAGDLVAAKVRWGDHMEKIITHRHKYTEFSGVLSEHPPEEIKAVFEWTA